MLELGVNFLIAKTIKGDLPEEEDFVWEMSSGFVK